MGQTNGWRRSSRCASKDCVDVWPGSTRTWVRDTTQPQTVLSVANADWRALLGALREGRLR